MQMCVLPAFPLAGGWLMKPQHSVSTLKYQILIKSKIHLEKLCPQSATLCFGEQRNTKGGKKTKLNEMYGSFNESACLTIYLPVGLTICPSIYLFIY